MGLLVDQFKWVGGMSTKEISCKKKDNSILDRVVTWKD